MALVRRLHERLPQESASGTILTVKTGPGVQFFDLTESISAWVRETGLLCGLVNVQSLHTTAGLVINENEPLLQDDLKRTLEEVAPRGVRYEHDDFSRRRGPLPIDEPVNGHAHCKAMVLPTTLSLNVIDGELTLGRWQRVFLVELDGPRKRDVSFVALGMRA